MLDVHPPHEATHTWKDFFIHVATICVGLLIAVGLEQSVEALHRRHERHKLQEALQRESRQVLPAASHAVDGLKLEIIWFRSLNAKMSEAVLNHHPVGLIDDMPQYRWDDVTNPVYKAAQASAKLDLLSDEEIVAYGELDECITDLKNAHAVQLAAEQRYSQFIIQRTFGRPANKRSLDFYSPAELKGLYDLIAEINIDALATRGLARSTRGAATALLQGERDLQKIQDAERRSGSLP